MLASATLQGTSCSFSASPQPSGALYAAPAPATTARCDLCKRVSYQARHVVVIDNGSPHVVRACSVHPHDGRHGQLHLDTPCCREHEGTSLSPSRPHAESTSDDQSSRALRWSDATTSSESSKRCRPMQNWPWSARDKMLVRRSAKPFTSTDVAGQVRGTLVYRWLRPSFPLTSGFSRSG
jgi:hypothetical protein